eukprot:UN18768
MSESVFSTDCACLAFSRFSGILYIIYLHLTLSLAFDF